MKSRKITVSLFLLVSWIAVPLSARVVRVEVPSQTAIAGGKPFGTAGPYERLTGKIYFSVAVANAHNRRIVDLANAVNLKNGQVAFSSDFAAIRPKNLSKGNGSLLLEIPNRGSAFIVALVDGGARDVVSDPGDGWLSSRSAGSGIHRTDYVFTHQSQRTTARPSPACCAAT